LRIYVSGLARVNCAAMSASYPTRSRRTALAPGILGTIALLIGVALIDTNLFIIIRYAVAILALIIAVFGWQARQWWWSVVMVAIAVLWNPVVPIDLGQSTIWFALQYVAGILFIIAGVLIKVPDDGKK
jgi:hypothetical protein